MKTRWRAVGSVAFSSLVFACGSSGARNPAAETPTSSEVVDSDPQSTDIAGGTTSDFTGGEELKLVVAELSELSSRTTPDAITLELRANIDHVGIRAHISSAGGKFVTGCQMADIYRIGRSAVAWPVNSSWTLPLAYDEVLPPGVYAQSIRIDMNGGGLDVTVTGSWAHFFEVMAGGLRPITSTEYSHRVQPVMYGLDGAPYYAGSASPADYEAAPEPCPEPARYSDEVAMADAISSVDFDSWSNVGTIQPFRWGSSTPPGTGAPASLEFRARNAAGGRLRLFITAPMAELSSGFEVSLESRQAQLVLDETELVSWHGSAGRIAVEVESGERLRVELSDVVLDKSRMVTEPEVQRTLATGSISGAWIRE